MKTEIALAAANQAAIHPPARDVPMLLEIECGMPVKDKKLHGRLHTGRPDTDNILKAVKDGLVDCGVLEDDSQVVATEIVKTYAPHPGYLVARLSQLMPDLG